MRRTHRSKSLSVAKALQVVMQMKALQIPVRVDTTGVAVGPVAAPAVAARRTSAQVPAYKTESLLLGAAAAVVAVVAARLAAMVAALVVMPEAAVRQVGLKPLVAHLMGPLAKVATMFKKTMKAAVAAAIMAVVLVVRQTVRAAAVPRTRAV